MERKIKKDELTKKGEARRRFKAMANGMRSKTEKKSKKEKRR